MANKNVTIKKRNASNTGWDEMFPVTTAENVKCGDGSSVEAQLGDIANKIDDIAYKTVSGTADAITVTKIGFTLVDGQYVEFKAITENTGSMTIDVNGLGVKSLMNGDGEDLSSGDIEQNKYYKAIYNGGSDFFQLAPRGGLAYEIDEQTFNRLYCSGYPNNDVYELNPDTLTIINTVEILDGATGIGGTSKRLYNCTSKYSDEKRHELNPNTLGIIRSYPYPERSFPKGIGGTATRLYTTTTAGADIIYELNPDTLATIKTIPDSQEGISGIGGTYSRLYKCDQSNKNYELNPNTLAIVKTVSSTEDGLTGIGGTYSRLYECHREYNNQKFYELNSDTLAIVKTVKAPDDSVPYGIGGFGYVVRALKITNLIKGITGFDSIQYNLDTYRK